MNIIPLIEILNLKTVTVKGISYIAQETEDLSSFDFSSLHVGDLIDWSVWSKIDTDDYQIFKIVKKDGDIFKVVNKRGGLYYIINTKTKEFMIPGGSKSKVKFIVKFIEI